MKTVKPGDTWLPVLGFEGAYEVSDLGQVRSLDRMVPYRIQGKLRKQRGRLLSPGKDDDGYLFVVLKDKLRMKQRTAKVAHLVLEAFVGPRPEGAEACHFPDRDPANNRLANLRWGTRKDNAADRERHGRTCRGDAHWARSQPERFRKVFQEAGWRRNEVRS